MELMVVFIGDYVVVIIIIAVILKFFLNNLKVVVVLDHARIPLIVSLIESSDFIIR